MDNLCIYHQKGIECPFNGTNDDPNHDIKFSHKVSCPLGLACKWLSDSNHQKEFIHTQRIISVVETIEEKRTCPRGLTCPFINEAQHISATWHDCQYGKAFCKNLKDEKHIANFKHNYSQRKDCPDGAKCKLIDDDPHCAQFSHLCSTPLYCTKMLHNEEKLRNHFIRFMHYCSAFNTQGSCIDKGKKLHDFQYKHVLNKVAITIEFPEEWEQVLHGNTEKFAKVLVKPTTPEYATIINIFNVSCQNARGALQYNRVLSLHRIENRSLWIMYATKKATMPNPNEKYLYHGCRTQEALSSIIEKEGFDFRIGKVSSLYGVGAYFSTRPAYCDSGYVIHNPDNSKEIILSRVLVGDHCSGEKKLTRPPNNPKTNRLYDSVTNENTTDPDMYIVFDMTQAFPAYIIKYT